MKSYIVIGMGRFGQSVAKSLYDLGNEVLAIDISEEQINAVSDNVTYAVVGNAQNLETLKSVGARDCDTGIVALGTDLAASIVITMNLKELGVRQVICKAQNEQYKLALEKVGADRVVIPEKVMAEKLAVSLSSSNVLDYISLSPDYSMTELTVPKSWVGRSIVELDIRAKHSVVLLAIKRGSEMIVSPDPNIPFSSNDIVLALGKNDALEKIRKI
mgnify:CR=1 FL=1